MNEPLAQGRDEVIYLICTHPRVKALKPESSGRIGVVRAKPSKPFAADVCWETEPFAWLNLPDEASASSIPWCLIDTNLESKDGLDTSDFNTELDPEAGRGRHRQEILAWMFDRHLDPDDTDRGSVDGGSLDFELIYVGMTTKEALARADGPHHMVSRILGQTLVFNPHLLVYVFPSTIHMGELGAKEAKSLEQARSSFGLSRKLAIEVAEEMLISYFSPSRNKRNTVDRVFPNSSSADELRAKGVEKVGFSIDGLPSEFQFRGQNDTSWSKGTAPCGWILG